MKVAKQSAIASLLALVAFLALGAVLVAQQPQPKPLTLTADQQKEFETAQRSVEDTAKALDVASARRLTIIYKIRSENGWPESKFDVALVDGRLVFSAKPDPTAKPK